MAEHESAIEAAEQTPFHADTAPELRQHAGIAGRSIAWIRDDGPWWLCSFVFHVILIFSLALLGG
jgi:hypothetical protein